MRRELLRQIAELEQQITMFRLEHGSYARPSETPQQGPVVLSSERLEGVRDELLSTLAALQDGVATRFADGLNVAPKDGDAQGPRSGRLTRWWRRLTSRG
jgi:hypothetical protein